jgi:hypothetical protein
MSRLRRFLFRRQIDRGLTDEICQHLKEKVDELVERGMLRDQALLEAR